MHAHYKQDVVRNRASVTFQYLSFQFQQNQYNWILNFFDNRIFSYTWKVGAQLEGLPRAL